MTSFTNKTKRLLDMIASYNLDEKRPYWSLTNTLNLILQKSRDAITSKKYQNGLISV